MTIVTISQSLLFYSYYIFTCLLLSPILPLFAWHLAIMLWYIRHSPSILATRNIILLNRLGIPSMCQKLFQTHCSLWDCHIFLMYNTNLSLSFSLSLFITSLSLSSHHRQTTLEPLGLISRDNLQLSTKYPISSLYLNKSSLFNKKLLTCLQESCIRTKTNTPVLTTLIPSHRAASEVACMYSDVAAGRPPSPNQEETPIANAIETPAVTPAETIKQVDSSSESKLSSDGGGLWTTVTRSRHTCSLDSVQMSQNKKPIIKVNPQKMNLSSEQHTMVETAKSSMTKEQMERITCWQGIIDAWLENEVETGPSMYKGKAIDPLEWENSGISNDELDVEAQQAALNAYKSYKEKHKKKRNKPKIGMKHSQCRNGDVSEADNPFTMPNITRHKHVNTSRRSMLVQPAERHASLRPATHIAPKSSLGAVLSELALRYQTHSPVRRYENPRWHGSIITFEFWILRLRWVSSTVIWKGPTMTT